MQPSFCVQFGEQSGQRDTFQLPSTPSKTQVLHSPHGAFGFA